jgi:hypothetical protein
MYARSSAVSKTRFSSSKSNSARELIATTSCSAGDGGSIEKVYAGSPLLPWPRIGNGIAIEYY